MVRLRKDIVVHLIVALIIGNINAVPFDFESLDDDTQFKGQPKYKHRLLNKDVNIYKSFGSVEVDDTDSDGTSHIPGVMFHQSFPFFGHDIFSTFPGIGGAVQGEPWYKGPNVCVDNSESENDKSSSEQKIAKTPSYNSDFEVRFPFDGQFHFSVNSCIEKPNKFVCTRIANKNGKKTTLTITRQCCHGYSRPRNAAFETPCDKTDVKNFYETGATLGATEFVTIAKAHDILTNMLSKRNISIFMPTDQSFDAYYKQRNSKTMDGAVLKKLFQRHIVDGETSLYDLSNDVILNTQNEDQTIRINLYQIPETLGPEPFRYTANCIPIENHDIMSEQGLVHTIDGVLKPATKNVMDLIRDNSDLSIMRTIIEKTKLNELLEGENPVTIFVPNNDAFERLEPRLRRILKEGKGCASNILKNHIIDLTFCSAATIVGAKTTAYNILGEPMRFNRSKSSSENTANSIIINGIAKTIDTDIMGTNGVLHIVDTVLPTVSSLPLSTLLKEKNLTLFMRLVEASGIDTTFDELDNVTVFAPTDKALQGTKWFEMLNSSNQLSKNSELVEFLNYHIGQPMIKTCDLSEQMIPTLANANVRINLYSTHALFSNVMNRATVNCARLVRFDDESCGSILHQIDKALKSPKKTLLELLDSTPNYSKFRELVRASNLSHILSNVEESYTLLIPKNDVFEEVKDWEKTLTKDKNELEDLVKSHIVNDVVCCAGIMPTNWPFVRSIESLNGSHLRISRDRRPKVENAGVVKCDNIAINGIIHEINDVIIVHSRFSHNKPQPSLHNVAEIETFF